MNKEERITNYEFVQHYSLFFIHYSNSFIQGHDTVILDKKQQAIALCDDLLCMGQIIVLALELRLSLLLLLGERRWLQCLRKFYDIQSNYQSSC
ncbi:MAG: hypothetical protein UT32_C0007G0023 [Parcubacteria group bacterium GW2011_GWC2_39_14]|nr:MAG: hypothetical protein UT32_C0007G0023 [Parcubacteria group bacterium GW2011_GWC2_39_14]